MRGIRTLGPDADRAGAAGKIEGAGKGAARMATVVAAFPSEDKARFARQELVQAGLPAGKVQMVGPQSFIDTRAALAEPEQNIVTGRAGQDNPALEAAARAGDILESARAGGDLPAVERQWLNHILLVISDLEQERVAGVTTALRQAGAEHVLVGR
ncbi:MAG: hypothetical protein AB1503_05470 [Bacillota bacterium]